jgi:hypothetical protein
MKTSELTGAALDWAVAKCEDKEFNVSNLLGFGEYYVRQKAFIGLWTDFDPSTDWYEGGRIIEREQLLIQPEIGKEGAGNAWSCISVNGYESFGPTLLVAAMRCYVFSRLGKEVEIPKELT